MDIVERLMKMSIVSNICVGKFIPDAAFACQSIFDIPSVGGRSMQVL